MASASEMWRFPRFFSERIDDKMAVVSGDDARHISGSLRMKKGDMAVICNKNGIDFLCRLEIIGVECIFEVVSSQNNNAEPQVFVRLYQALPKGDKMDFIVQKAVELGASEIVPMLSERCISRPDIKSAAKKLERFNRIAYEAAKQCGRGKIPIVNELVDFKSAVLSLEADEKGIFFYECGGERLDKIVSDDKKISIIIGSEGGFSEKEAEFAEKNGWKTATLGPRILRCETAPIAALSVLMNLTEK